MIIVPAYRKANKLSTLFQSSLKNLITFLKGAKFFYTGMNSSIAYF